MTALDIVPALHQALLAGRIDPTKTRMIVNEVAFVDEQYARPVVDRSSPTRTGPPPPR